MVLKSSFLHKGVNLFTVTSLSIEFLSSHIQSVQSIHLRHQVDTTEVVVSHQCPRPLNLWRKPKPNQILILGKVGWQCDQITAASWSGNTCQPTITQLITPIRLLFGLNQDNLRRCNKCCRSLGLNGGPLAWEYASLAPSPFWLDYISCMFLHQNVIQVSTIISCPQAALSYLDLPMSCLPSCLLADPNLSPYQTLTGPWPVPGQPPACHWAHKLPSKLHSSMERLKMQKIFMQPFNFLFKAWQHNNNCDFRVLWIGKKR